MTITERRSERACRVMSVWRYGTAEEFERQAIGAPVDAGHRASMLAESDGLLRTYQEFMSYLRLVPLLIGGPRGEHGAEEVGGALVSCVYGVAVDVRRGRRALVSETAGHGVEGHAGVEEV